jgi:site-specific recombinase XerD
LPVDGFALVSQWIHLLEAQDYSPDTVRNYSGAVCRLLARHVQGPPSATTEDHVVDFLRSMADRAPSKYLAYQGLRSFFRFCVARRILDVDPMALIRVKPPRARKAVCLEEDELVRYLVAAANRDPRRAWVLMLSFGVGTRRMEAAGIAPSDVLGDFDAVQLRTCKGGKRRTVELSYYAREALRELRPWWNGTVLGGVDRSTVTSWAHEAAVDSGLLPKVAGRVSHVLRASFATHLLRRGTPVHVVRDLLGHENLATTNRYAAEATRGERMAAVAHLRFPSGDLS